MEWIGHDYIMACRGLVGLLFQDLCVALVLHYGNRINFQSSTADATLQLGLSSWEFPACFRDYALTSFLARRQLSRKELVSFQ